MTLGVVVVAGGSGSRLGAAVPKAFVDVAGRSLLRRALDRVLAVPQVAEVAVVAPADHLDTAVACLGPDEHERVAVVAGGADRRDSVLAGLARLSPAVDLVLVHDAARALAPPVLFVRVVDALESGADAVVPGLVVVDTVKEVDATGLVVRTPPRSSLRAVQTPQGFRREVLERAHEAHDPASPVTDDAGLVEALGLPVLVVDGDPRAHKVTVAADLDLARRLLEAEEGRDPEPESATLPTAARRPRQKAPPSE